MSVIVVSPLSKGGSVMPNPDDPNDTSASAARRATAHCSVSARTQIRLLTGALELCRNMLPPDADPHFVARIYDLERRLDELIADAGSPNPRRPPQRGL